MRRWWFAAVCLGVFAVSAACAPAAAPAAPGAKEAAPQAPVVAAKAAETKEAPAQRGPTGKVRVIKVFGTVHAPFTVMARRKMIESKHPGVQMELTTLVSGQDSNLAILSDNADVGTVGAAPLLIAWDKGVPYKIGGTVGYVPIKLITNRDEIKTLKDLLAHMQKSGEKIAVIGLGTLQHQIVQMAAEKEFGNAKALDSFLVAMPQPESRAALKAKREIAARISTPPALTQELQEPGVRALLDAFDVVGEEFPLSMAGVSQRLHDRQPEIYKIFVDTLKEAIDWVNANPDETAKILSEDSGGNPPPAVFLQDLRSTKFDLTPKGIMRFADFMYRAGHISKKPASWKDLTWENLHHLNGS